MYFALGVAVLIIAVIVLGFVCYTLLRSIIVEKDPISKKNIVYLLPSALLIYSLYVVAAIYNGEDVNFFYLVKLISYTLEMYTLKPMLSLIFPISRDIAVFYADFVIAQVLASLTIILSVISLFGKTVRNFIAKCLLFRRNCDIVIGDSPEALKYAKHNKNCLVLCERITRQRYSELLKEGYFVKHSSLTSNKFIKKT
jgi:hypothetical protein